MRPIILICLALFVVAMIGVRFAAHEFVAVFGTGTAFALIVGMYLTARYFERRA